ncbi:Eukaryotic elongation factor-2 kinase [Puccinia graminis f. sp. tritici]|uniref:Eukaryotic elongation factor-2 kinase n=1 Tax=Puccinia graminis f. sp. tritici TaxID=56615 RepID=A0A5B0QR88_PUCGR|nr:Eukaryotic elongation factor-2 kinase [Puccinia graminis f. sp. tritici]
MYYKRLAQESRAGKNKEPPPPKKTQQGGSKQSTAPASDKRWLKCGLLVYIDGILQKKTGIIKKMIKMNIKNPNFYEDLQKLIWDEFSTELLAAIDVEAFPDSPLQYTSLATGETRLTRQEDVIDLANTGLTISKPSNINLIYQHPQEEYGTSAVQTRATPVTTRASKRRRTEPVRKTSNSEGWELGGTSATHTPNDTGSLSTQIMQLGQPVRPSIGSNINIWTEGQRLVLYANNSTPPPEAENRPIWKISQHINAISLPLNFKVNRNKHVGKGSSCMSYPAKVQSFSDGIEVITNWVAKVRFAEKTPKVNNYASDALVYQCFAMHLEAHKIALRDCKKLDMNIKKKQIKFRISALVLVNQSGGQFDNNNAVDWCSILEHKDRRQRHYGGLLGMMEPGLHATTAQPICVSAQDKASPPSSPKPGTLVRVTPGAVRYLDFHSWTNTQGSEGLDGMKPHIFEQILGKENPGAVPTTGIVDFCYTFLDVPEKPSTQVFGPLLACRFS